MRLRHQLFQKCEKKSLKFDFCLLPLDGDGSAVPSFRLHPVFGAVSSRVPPDNATSRFVGFGGPTDANRSFVANPDSNG